MLINKKIFFILALVLFTSLSFSAHSLSLRGNRLSPIIFEPGKNITNHYLIEDTNKKVVLNLGGDLLDYIRVTEIVDSQFDLIIEVPEELPEPGSYSFSLQANEISSTESSGKGSGVGSLLSVSLRFLVEVPPHGKAISVSLNIPDTNEHQDIPVSLNVESKGLEEINLLSGIITVYDLMNNSVTSLKVKGNYLPPLQSTVLAASIPADTLPPAKYWAEAVVDYDGLEKRTQDLFKIGNLDLILVNYTSQLEQEFAEFKAAVENNWGNPIQIAYAKVFIAGEELLTTPTISLEPWQRGELKGILRTDFALGDHNGSIQLFFDDLSKTEAAVFTIIEPLKYEKDASLPYPIIIAIVIILALVLTAIFVWRKNK